MASNAHQAQGTFLQKERDGAPGTFDTVAEARNLRGPNKSVADMDVTSHSSTLGTKEYKPGLIEPGQFQADIFYLPENSAQTELETDFTARTVVNWRLIINSLGVTLGYRTGQGYVKELGDQFPSDGNMMTRALTVKLTGPWPYTPGSP